MISPHTPPKTKIVCIDNDPDSCTVAGWHYLSDSLHGLARDGVYTLLRIEPRASVKTKFIAVLSEIDRGVGHIPGFDLSRFRYLHLPRSLTDLLETAPTRAPSELEPTQ